MPSSYLLLAAQRRFGSSVIPSWYEIKSFFFGSYLHLQISAEKCIFGFPLSTSFHRICATFIDSSSPERYRCPCPHSYHRLCCCHDFSDVDSRSKFCSDSQGGCFLFVHGCNPPCRAYRDVGVYLCFMNLGHSPIFGPCFLLRITIHELYGQI